MYLFSFLPSCLVLKSSLDQNSVEGWDRKFLSSTMPACWSLERNIPSILEQHFNVVPPSVLDKVQLRVILIASQSSAIKEQFLLKTIDLVTVMTKIGSFMCLCSFELPHTQRC